MEFTLPTTITTELDRINENFNKEAEKIVQQMNAGRMEIIFALIKGYLADKDIPQGKDFDMKIEEDKLTLVEKTDSEDAQLVEVESV